MKKTLAILALVAAGAAFAQPKVGFSGNFDLGVSHINAQDPTANKTEVITGGSSTSLITLTAEEDLGQGLKAIAKAQTTVNINTQQTGNGTTAFSTNQLFNDEVFLGLQNKVGAVKLGVPTVGMFETNRQANPFGTAPGSGYASTGINRLLGATSTLGVNSFLGGASANGRVVRHEKAVRVETATFAGFSANATRSFGNDNSTTATSNNNQFTDVTVNYRAGAANFALSQAKVEAGANAAQGNNAAGALNAGANVTYQFFAANYTMGPATVYYGQTTGKTANLTGGDKDVSSRNIGVKYVVSPRLDLLANKVWVNDRTSANVDQDNLALGAVYKFSKTTSAYATAQRYDAASNNDSAGRQTQYIVGMRTQF